MGVSPELCKVRHIKTGVSGSAYRIATFFNIQCFRGWVGNRVRNTKFSYMVELVFRHGHGGNSYHEECHHEHIVY